MTDPTEPMPPDDAAHEGTPTSGTQHDEAPLSATQDVSPTDGAPNDGAPDDGAPHEGHPAGESRAGVAPRGEAAVGETAVGEAADDATPAAGTAGQADRPVPQASTPQVSTPQPTQQPEPGASRFPSTGDAQVDEALAALPDPQRLTGAGGSTGARPAASDDDSAGSTDAERGHAVPDAEQFDQCVADVTTVHSRLQRRLSDLSG